MKIKTLISAFALAWASQTFAQMQEILPLNGIAMEINSSIITYGDIQREVNMLKSMSAAAGVTEEELHQAARARLLERTLLIDAARDQGLQASNAEVDAEIHRRAKAQNISEKSLYERVEKLGWTRQQYRISVAKDLVLDRLFTSIDEQIKISNGEVLEYIEQAKKEGRALPQAIPYTIYQVRRLTIALDENTNSSAAENRIKLIAQSIEHGNDFSEMARRYSHDATAANGGLTSLIAYHEPAVIDEALQTLQIGQISTPLQTAQNWQLIQLVSKQTETNPIKVQEEAVRRHLIAQARQQAQSQFINQLQQNAILREF